ncbi:MAG: hypothetical protein KatS3mg015_0566 [Fimbriimonadales bacterium]|nr:MAG: hypothetical protein KatS3mg015_0566 [Fimbriimonadales bacterium]
MARTPWKRGSASLARLRITLAERLGEFVLLDRQHRVHRKKWIPKTHDGNAPPGVRTIRPEIGWNLFALDGFEATLAECRQVLCVAAALALFVEQNWNLVRLGKCTRDRLDVGESVGFRHTVLLLKDKRAHIERADTRVGSRVGGEINEREKRIAELEESRSHLVGISRKSGDDSVVIRVGFVKVDLDARRYHRLACEFL